jgi:hypothetical protein
MAKTPEIEKNAKDVRRTSISESPLSTSPPSKESRAEKPTKGLKLWVELRHLTVDEKETYEKMATEPDRIVGELKENGEHYVFAAFDGIAYRVNIASFLLLPLSNKEQYTFAQAKDMWLDKVDDFCGYSFLPITPS